MCSSHSHQLQQGCAVPQSPSSASYLRSNALLYSAAAEHAALLHIWLADEMSHYAVSASSVDCQVHLGQAS